MSCGMIAMIEGGVEVERYDAYEIDKYAIKTSTHNFPQIVHHGDVFDADFTQYKGYDFLIGGSPCFTAGHLVLTDRGYKDIADVKVGDSVMTHVGRYRKVVRVNQRYTETVAVKINGYPVFITTPEHPFYTITRHRNSHTDYKRTGSWRGFSEKPTWTAAKDLTCDHFCGQRITTGSGKNKHDINAELAYILGRYVADGHIRKTKRKGRKDSYQYQVILSIGAGKIEQFKKNVTNRHFSCYKHTDNVYRCVFNSKELLEFIDENGFGKKAYNKNIPEFIFDLPPYLQESFLNGYMDGDGCFVRYSGTWTASTVSPTLAFGLQRLVTQLYATNVSVSKRDNSRCGHKIGNREIHANYPAYTVLFKKEIRKQTVAHLQDGIIWTNVKAVKPTGRIERVYNIEVEEDQSYTVNNCIVHNCTFWSIAQRPDKRETVASGLGWELFSQYVRALHEAQPRMFIYENNKSMSKDIRASITETFGFEPICINSALVSAQNRQRLYWVGIRQDDGTYRKASIEQPADRGILLKDVLDSAQPLATTDGKGFACTATYWKGSTVKDTITKHRRTMCAEPARQLTEREMEYMVRDHGDRRWNYAQRPGDEEKGCCLTANVSRGVPYNVCAEPACVASRGRNPDTPDDRVAGTSTEQRFEAHEDGKTNTLTSVSKDNLIAEPTTPQEPQRVGTMPRERDGKQTGGQAFRIYSPDGKGATIKANSGGGGGKTGLYATQEEPKREQRVYEVKDGMIEVNGKRYPIKLCDGRYIIRKLSVTECMRLQTVPEWYDFSCVSNTQAYKMLGNGWTVQVIVHIINSLLK